MHFQRSFTMNHLYYYREVLSIKPQDLPTAEMSHHRGANNSSHYCDTCSKKGQKTVIAVIYCTDDRCKEKYYEKHKKVCLYFAISKLTCL